MNQIKRSYGLAGMAATLYSVLLLSFSTFAQPPADQGDKKQPIVTPRQLSLTFAEVTKKVEPAVVSIDAKGRMPEVARRGSGQNAPGDLLDFLNRQIPRRPSYSIGSGFIVDKKGYILTNAHVVEDSAKITVKLNSGEEYQARVIGVDNETDIAVLKIDPTRDLPVAKLGDSENVQVGDWVLAIGSPFGLSRTVTAGIISQTQRSTPGATLFQRFIQTDAAINRGNSGGPLVNMDGEVIGVNSQIATSNGDYNGIGFALPSTDAGYVFDQILKSGRVRRGFLGVTLESVGPEFAKVYGMREAKGAIVMEIVRASRSAAFEAGLRSGDVIVEFDGKPVENAQDLIAKVAGTPPDRSVAVNYLRETGPNLERRTATLKLGERPPGGRGDEDEPVPVRLPVDRKGEEAKPFGMTLSDVTPEMAATYRLVGHKGAIVQDINPESFIADVKAWTGGQAIGEGDLIVRINRLPVDDVKAFTAIVSNLKPGDAVVLNVLSLDPRSRTANPKIVQFTVQ
ncbi:MAG: trypsin-like peptidase domain-containing protein [Chloracidobacterium sp.]|nr:trypsin-like peptidase domain-containing protein [Chloracidobacterium sp.]